MKKCTQCGIDLFDEDIYCPNCGTKVPEQVKPKPTPAPAPVVEPKPVEPQQPVDNGRVGFFDKKLKNGLPIATLIGTGAIVVSSLNISIACMSMPPIGVLVAFAAMFALFGVIWNTIVFFCTYKKPQKQKIMKWMPLIFAGIALGLFLMCCFL